MLQKTLYAVSYKRRSAMKSDLREHDIRIEGYVGQFLDRYFYHHLVKETDYKVERNNDIDLQYKGVDVYIYDDTGDQL